MKFFKKDRPVLMHVRAYITWAYTLNIGKILLPIPTTVLLIMFIVRSSVLRNRAGLGRRGGGEKGRNLAHLNEGDESKADRNQSERKRHVKRECYVFRCDNATRSSSA